MLLLDTNVLSELLKPAPNQAILAWLDAQPRSQLFTTSITRAEILYGVALLPRGSRREKLRKAAAAIFDEDLEDKVLSFDAAAADHCADLAARRKQADKPIGQLDAMIVGIAQAHQARLATRNIRTFVDCEIQLVDPWN